MKVIKYRSIEEVSQKATELHQSLFDSGVSVSFRTYDKNGNTLEFHAHYLPLTNPTK